MLLMYLNSYSGYAVKVFISFIFVSYSSMEIVIAFFQLNLKEFIFDYLQNS